MHGDLSKWDVSRVTTITAMFRQTQSFNGDISKWDVTSVTKMDYMFQDATSYKQKLCGAAWVLWVHSKASKTLMFAGSPGSISPAVCKTTVVFSPRSKAVLQRAIKECIEVSPKGDCSTGPHGPIAGWDVSSVTGMNSLFSNLVSFNGFISQWDVSHVTNMF